MRFAMSRPSGRVQRIAGPELPQFNTAAQVRKVSDIPIQKVWMIEKGTLDAHPSANRRRRQRRIPPVQCRPGTRQAFVIDLCLRDNWWLVSMNDQNIQKGIDKFNFPQLNQVLGDESFGASRGTALFTI
jgi:hypothetical protein